MIKKPHRRELVRAPKRSPGSTPGERAVAGLSSGFGTCEHVPTCRSSNTNPAVRPRPGRAAVLAQGDALGHPPPLSRSPRALSPLLNPRTRRPLAAALGRAAARGALALAAVLGVGTGGTALAQGGVCDRTTAVADSIVAAVPGVSNCANVTAAHLAAITELMNLSKAGLTSLQAGDFAGLSSLTTELDLSENGLTSLPAGIFDDLTALTDLSLRENSLASLPEGIFDNLTALTGLHLPNNSLSTLRAGVFDSLTALTRLDLNDNSLASLPDDVFVHLTALTNLSLGGNGQVFAPLASAGEDQSLQTGVAVTLLGTATGPWGDTRVTWAWTQVDGADSIDRVTGSAAVALTGANTATPTFTAPSSATTLHFMLFVDTRPASSGVRGASFDRDWVTVTVTPANTAPTAANGTVTTNEDTAHTFAASEFGFTDTDSGDTLASVRVTTLPASGELRLSGTAIASASLPQTVTAAQLTANNLTFVPVADANGTGYATFMFTVNDGTADSASAYTMTINVTAVNDAATGAPTITGTAEVGQTLTANLGTIADVDELPTTTFPTGYNFQWRQGTADISGATFHTYMPVAVDVGQKLTVQVSFTDGAGNSETRTSAETAPVVADTTPPTLNRASVIGGGNLIDLRFSENIDRSNLPPTTAFTVTSGGAARTVISVFSIGDTATRVGVTPFILQGKTVVVTYTDPTTGNDANAFQDAAGNDVATFTTGENSVPTVTNNSTQTNHPATGSPTITGTAQVDQTLTANLGTIADVDELPTTTFPTGYRFQWRRGTADISGATSHTYMPVAADVGQKLTVQVSFTDGAGNSETRTSAETATVVASTNTAPTAANGTVTTNEDTAHTFAASDFGFTDSDTGDTLASVKVTSLPASGELRLSGTAIASASLPQTVTAAQLTANNLTFVPVADANGDAYATFMFRVNDGEADSASAYTMTINVTAVNDPATGAPSISGAAHVDGTLTADRGTIADVEGLPASFPADYTFQWIRVDGTDEADISEATASTYMPVAEDLGKKLKVRASFTDGAGTGESATSAAYPDSGTVAAAPMLSVLVDPASIQEVAGSEVATLTVSTGSTAFATDQTIALEVSGTATWNVDYTFITTPPTMLVLVSPGSLELTLPAGSTSVAFFVQSFHDIIDEPDETVLITASHGGTNIGAQQTVTIVDDDAAPVLSVSVAPPSIVEDAGVLATLTVSTGSTAFATDQTIALEVSGTATWNADYDFGSILTGILFFVSSSEWELRLPAGSTSVQIFVNPIADTIDEADETVLITASLGGMMIGTQQTVTITDANTAPTAANGTVTTNEDTAHTFAASEFGFSDSDTGDTLASVKVTSLLSANTGTLALDGMAVTVDQVITKADLDANRLTYTPPANANGDAYATFMFTVNDGTDDSASAYTMTIDVTAVNDAPEVATEIPNQSATVGVDFSYAFPDTTFRDVDSPTPTYTAELENGSDLPTWLTFTAGTRTFSGTPTSAGTLMVKVTATDADSASVSDTFNIAVASATDVCSRTTQVRDAIVAAVSGVSDCADLTPAHLAGITGTLLLASAGLTSLQAGDFDGLTALNLLALGNNDLAELPEGIFDDLAALTGLALFANDLTMLPADIFDNLTAMTTLALHLNDLSTLPADIFDRVTRLTALHLNDNELSTLPADIFDSVTRLTALHLNDNELTTLPPGIFSGLTALTTLALQNNPGAPFSPTAGAGVDQSVQTGLAVELAGTVSGPWGNTRVTWAWTQVDGAESNTAVDAASAVTLTGGTTAAPTFTAPSSATDLHFRLVVSPSPAPGSNDGTAASDADWVTVTVMSDNTAPTAANGTVTTNEDTAHTFAASEFGFTDTDSGDTLASVTVTSLPTSGTGTLALSGTAVTANQVITKADIDANNLAYTPPANANGDAYATFMFTVNDGEADSASAYTMTIDVTAVNDAPVVANEIPNQSATIGVDFSYTFPDTTFSDVETATPTYAATQGDNSALPTWLTFTAATRTFSGTPTSAGTLMVKVTATDADSASVSDTFNIRIAATDVCSRTPAVRDAIVAAVAGVDDCADLTPAHLAGIAGTLNLNSAGITSLRSGDFDGLSGLTQLHLEGNSLTTLPGDIFDELTALTELWLSQNSLTTLPGGIFDELTVLTVLALGHNSLTTLPGGIFDELTALTELGLHSNNLSTLSAGVFDALTALQSLLLASNNLSTLPADIFDGLSALRDLQLIGNSLSTLPANIFDDLTALTALNLNSNNLSALPENIFEDLTALTDLGLAFNSGAPFSPTAGAGGDQSVQTGVALELAGTATGPWGDGNVTWAWTQVDGAASNTAVAAAAAVALTGGTTATPSFTAPSSAATLHFRLVVSPVPAPDAIRGTAASAADWVTVTVTATDTTAPTVSTAASGYYSDAALTTAASGAQAAGTGVYTRVKFSEAVAHTESDAAAARPEIFYKIGSGAAVQYDVVSDATTLASGDCKRASATDSSEYHCLYTVAAADSGAFTFEVGTNTQDGADNALAARYTHGTTLALGANTAPTAANGTVTTNEDTAHTFADTDFGFSDTDTGDTLASVTVTSLPASGTGVLALSGTAVTLNQVIPKADIDADNLTYTPPADANGAGYASFGFRVNDGTEESVSAYTMTIDVTAVNDPATGAPAISGTAQVGLTLTAGIGTIADVDDLPGSFPADYTFVWIRVDGTDEADLSGETASTYTPVPADVGKKLKVKVSFTDAAGTAETLTSAAYPGTGTVTAAAMPVLEVSVTSAAIPEAGGISTVEVSTGSGPTFATDQTITLTLAGTATKITDYTISSESLTLAAGATLVTATVTGVDDIIDDDAETVLITATHNSDTIGAQQTVTITDDDAAPVLAISVSPPSVAEAGGVSTVTVDTGTGSTFATDQAITLTLAGTAAPDADYMVGSTSLTLPAGVGTGASSIATDITAVDDKIDDDAETVLVTAMHAGATVGAQQTVTITDDDAAPALVISVSPPSVAEAGGVSTVTVDTGTGSTFATGQAITLALAGTATEVDDYTVGSTSLTLPAGVGTGASSIATDIMAVDDRIDDDAETVLVTAMHAGATVGTQQTVTITDDDAAPVLAISVSPASIAEAGGVSTVTVDTGTGSTFATDQAITLALAGTATEVDDYTVGSTSLTLPAGVGTGASSIATDIMAVDDDFYEGTSNEQITVTGLRAGANFGSTRTITIAENEQAPKLTLMLTDGSIPENGGSTMVTASVSPRTVDAFTATVTIAPDAPATAADYTLTGSLSFAALAADSTGDVSIEANDNRVDRPDKTLRVAAASSLAYFRATDEVVLTLVDEDAPPAPVLEVSGSPTAENGGVATLTVTTGTGSTFPEARTVTLELDGTAAENTDYRVASRSLTLPAGSGLGVSTVSTTLTGIDDIIDDDGETVLVDAAIGSTPVGTQQTVVIADDDASPTVTVGVSPESIAENGGIATVTVTTDTGASTFAADQTITLTLGGTAAETEDYTIASRSLTLPAGVGNNHSTVTTTITALDDRIDEAATETVTIDAMREGAAVGTQQTLELQDDDAAPVLQLTATSTQIAENGGVSTLTVGTGTGSTFEDEQTIGLTVTDVTTLRNSDYSVGATTLTLPAGAGLEPSSASTTVTGRDDPNYEGQADQTFTVAASHGGAPVGTPITIGIDDDESPSKPAIVFNPSTISEGSNVQSQITATVSPPAEVGFWLRAPLPRPFTRYIALGAPGILGGSSSDEVFIEFAPGASASVPRQLSFAVQTNEEDDGDAQIVLTGEPVGYDLAGQQVQPNPLPGILSTDPATLTIEDDDISPVTVELSVDVAEVDEGAGPTAVTVRGTLSEARTEGGAVTVAVTVGSGSGEAGAAAGTDFAAVDGFDLSIAQSEIVGEASFTLTPTEDTIDEPDETVSVTGTTAAVGVGVQATSVSIADNDDAPVPVLSVEPDSIAEAGGVAEVTVSTGTGSTYASEQTVILTLTGTATRGGDYTVGPTTLTLPAGVGSESSEVVTTVTAVDDGTAEGAETVVVGGSVGGEDFAETQTVTIEDDEGTPVVTLVLSPAAVSEGATSTVTATVSPASGTAFTVTVASAAVSPAEAGDFAQSGSTLSFAAGASTSTGSVSIAAAANSVDTPDREVLVSGTVSSTGISAPADVTLTILDDDTPAALTLQVEPFALAEDGGTATVTVTTGTGSTFATDQDIDLVLGGSATQGEDYSISATELTLPAGASSVTATLTGLDDAFFEGEETILISGVSNGAPFGAEVTVTINDDEEAPAVTLVLTTESIDEDGGTATVTATVSPASTEPFTVIVAVEVDAPAVAEDFVLAGDTLTFEANATESSGEVTITAVNNDVDAPNKTLRVTGTVSVEGVIAPPEATLTIVDEDEASTTVTLSVAPDRIDEGAPATQIEVTGTLDADARPSETVISLSLGGGGSAASPGVDYETLADFNLTIPANETSATATFTLTPLEDRIDEADEAVVLTGSPVTAGIGVPETAGVAIADNDDAPVLAIGVAPASIEENGGTATVTVTTGEGSTFEGERTIAFSLAGTATRGEDYRLPSATATLPAGMGTDPSTATATVTALDDDIDDDAETIVIGGLLDGVAFGTEQTVTIVDDDDAEPAVVTLVLTPDSIGEDGETSTVTATVAPASPEAFTVTVTAAAVAPAVAGDFTLAGATLSFAADATESTGEVTVTAVDNDEDAPDKTVTVSGTVSSDGVTAPADATLTITDDDAVVEPPPGETPAVTLVLTPDSIGEGGETSTVTATVAPASPEAFTVTVTAAAVAPAVAGDFTLAGATLSFAADATESTGEVTVTAVDNDEDAPDKTVTVSGTVSSDGVTAPADATLTITDDDAVVEPPPGETPAVTLVLTPDSIGEGGETSTVTATVAPASPEAFTVTVTAAAVAPAVAGDFTLAGATLSFAADATESTGEVTVTAVDNDEDAPDKTVTVSGTVSSDGVTAPADATLTITDDDAVVEPPPGETPAVTLVLTPDSIGEGGETSTVTATVAPASPEAFTVTVTAAAVSPAVAGDFTLAGATLSFAADATESTGEVTVTAVDNDEDAPDKTVTVSGTVSSDGVTAPADATLTITDDDAVVEPPPGETPAVTLVLTPDSIGEGGETSTVTATVAPASPEAFTVTVTAAAVSPAVAGDFTLAGTTLSFAADATESTGEVTVTAVDNDEDAPDKTVTVSGMVSSDGVTAPADATLTITDDEAVVEPPAGEPDVSIADARGMESDGQLVFEVTLSRAAEQAVSVAYATSDSTARAGEDYQASTGTATIGAGESSAQIAVPLLLDLFSETDETFVVTLTSADGARLVDAQAIGTIEDTPGEGAASQQWLSRFGRVAGGHVMAAIGEQIAANRVGGPQVTVAGNRLTGAGASGVFGANAGSLDRFGLAPSGGWGGTPALSAGDWNWRAQPGEWPWSGGAGSAAYGNTAGYGFAPTRAMSGRELLANSAFLLNAGPGGGGSVSIWGRGNYTRFDNLGEGLQAGGDAVSATLGVDWACGRCLLGMALSHTAVDATYGDSGQDTGELQSSVTGLYPYFGVQLTERFSVWGLVGRGQGELTATTAAGARPVEVELETGVAGFGARGELLADVRKFSLAVKTDALISRASTGEAEGILEAEGEYRRMRLGLEGAWLSDLGEKSSLRTSLEVAAREDAGEDHNGVGVEVGGALEFIGVAPGLSLDVAVRGLVSHEAEDYEEWGVSGGFRYDPDPGTPAGPLVSLSHSWGPAGSGGLQQALWRSDLSRTRTPTPSRGARSDMLSAEFAYGFKAFGALAIPWARFGTTGAGEEYRLGYSLLTDRGIPSLEFARSAFGREYRMGWEFAARCRVQVAVQVLHTDDALGQRDGTGFEIRFRSVPRKRSSDTGACETLRPLFGIRAPRAQTLLR